MPSSPAPAGGPRRLTRTLYRYAFLDEFVLLYPVYALLFSDTGLSVWQISSLFALWSLTGVVLEVPSGALADGTSRRRLLVLAPLLTATGFALWVLLPSYASFAVGFVLWGAGGALGSASPSTGGRPPASGAGPRRCAPGSPRPATTAPSAGRCCSSRP
ncbi:hypothetical protein B0E37_00789 [Streptomyces sp. MH192]|nr:hypothetical protein [Streptomyces sp. MH192]